MDRVVTSEYTAMPVYANGRIIGYIVRVFGRGSFYVQTLSVHAEELGYARCYGINYNLIPKELR